MTSFTEKRRALASDLVSRFVPKHYVTPTSEYAVEKALKEITSAIFFRVEKLGIHVLPKHFYTPLPDYQWLRANRGAWQDRNELRGLDFDSKVQLEWVRQICEPYLPEVKGLARFDALAHAEMGPGFGPIESQVLHCFIRTHQPAQVMEVGSGVTTAIMSEAAQMNRQDGRKVTTITAYDPYPRARVRQLPDVEIVPTFVQQVPIAEFDRLGDGDLLFIDSSHAVKIGSDVIRLFLDIIPRLKPGVFIHIHDIYLPYLYPRTALSDYFGWQETALIHALLTNNSSLQTRACLSYLNYDEPAGLKEILPDYRPQEHDHGLRKNDWVENHFPDSLWLQTV